MVVPHRPAVLTAKILATLDYLSKGRLTLGIGAGWCKEEFEAIGAPPFDDRGHVTDEWMMVCKELWTSDAPKFDGKYVKFSDVLFPPKPVQNPIPIWVGGESGPAMRRTAKYGDAWYPIGTNPQFPDGHADPLQGRRGKAARHDRKGRPQAIRCRPDLSRVVKSRGAAEGNGGRRAQAVLRRRSRLRRRHQGACRGRRQRRSISACSAQRWPPRSTTCAASATRW